MNAHREELSRYRKALASHLAVAAGGDCPRPERIWEAVRGELRSGQVAALADHTLACGDCSLAWQLAVELGRESARPARLLRRPSAAPWRRQIWGGVLAAAAAVMLAVAIPWQDLGERPAPGVRGGQPTASSELVLATPEEPVPPQKCVLRWTSPWPDAKYSITVRSEDHGRIVARASGLTATEYQVPADRLAGVAPGTVLFWTVTATGPDGERLDRASSPLLLE